MSNQDYAITGPDREKVLEELVRLQQQYEELHTLTADIMREQGAEVERLKKENDRLREELANAKEYKARLARIMEQRQNAIERDRDELRAEVEEIAAAKVTCISCPQNDNCPGFSECFQLARAEVERLKRERDDALSQIADWELTAGRTSDASSNNWGRVKELEARLEAVQEVVEEYREAVAMMDEEGRDTTVAVEIDNFATYIEDILAGVSETAAQIIKKWFVVHGKAWMPHVTQSEQDVGLEWAVGGSRLTVFIGPEGIEAIATGAEEKK